MKLADIMNLDISDRVKNAISGDVDAQGEEKVLAELKRVASRFGMTIPALLEKYDEEEAEFEDE